MGKKEDGIDYIKRPAAYSVIFQSGKIAVVQTADEKHFLPGGGIEHKETHKECLAREALEEIGMEIEVRDYIGAAQRYFYSTNEYKYYLSEGYFYICEIIKQIGVPTEEDHMLKWIDPMQASITLFHKHQSWEVEEAYKLTRIGGIENMMEGSQ